jgi:UDP-N-acetylmuramoylalanine--D-glutamate ligase
VGGNIGRSLLPELNRLNRRMWAVMELSSFQLDLVERSPHGAVWLNLAANHIDIHGSMEAYAKAKRRILEFQCREEDWVILPFRDEAVLAAAGDLGGRRYFVGIDGPVPIGCYADGDMVWWRESEGGRSQAVTPIRRIRLPGRHNLFNFAAATAAILLAGGRIDAVAELASSFAGVPHRLEPVAVVGEVAYVNDSIATAPDRTAAALKAVAGPIVLIAGGYDKHLDYAPLGRDIANARVRAVVVLGQTAGKIQRAIVAAGASCSVIQAPDFDQAVILAAQAAQPGDTVLLSPASASYDMFTNFEERGERFRQMVDTL